MNKLILPTILLLLANSYTKADVQELLLDTKTYLPPLSRKINTSYLPAAESHYQHLKPNLKIYGKIAKSSDNYIHNKPKVIDDPLPMKVDYIKPLEIDFKNDRAEPIFKGAIFSELLFNVYEKPLFRLRPARESPFSRVIAAQDEGQTFGKAKSEVEAAFKSSEHNIKAASSLESQIYVKNPAEVDIIPINLPANPATKFKLFNYDDDNELSGSAPVVIFKPGDDIAFIKDTTVIDDYEHKFTEEEYNRNKKFNTKKGAVETSTKAFTKPFTKNDLVENKNEHTGTAAASSSFYTKASADAQPSAATQHIVTHVEESGKDHSEYGYVYDKPKIPFTS